MQKEKRIYNFKRKTRDKLKKKIKGEKYLQISRLY